MEQQGDYITQFEESDIVSAARKGRSLCGVYFLILDSKVVYVGQSVNIPSRISQHRQDKGKEFDKYHYIECDERDLDEVEQFYIRKFKPSQNKKLYGSQTLKVARRDKPVIWLKSHPVFSRFPEITLREWMRRAGVAYNKALKHTPRELTTFGDFYRWLKRHYPRLQERHILPNDVTRYFAQRSTK
jgi:hypothetical protein